MDSSNSTSRRASPVAVTKFKIGAGFLGEPSSTPLAVILGGFGGPPLNLGCGFGSWSGAESLIDDMWPLFCCFRVSLKWF
jgi:hypothetical protein